MPMPPISKHLEDLVSGWCRDQGDSRDSRKSTYATSSVPSPLDPEATRTADKDREETRGSGSASPRARDGGDIGWERAERRPLRTSGVRRPGASLEDGTAPPRLSLLAGGGGRRTWATDPPLDEAPRDPLRDPPRQAEETGCRSSSSPPVWDALFRQDVERLPAAACNCHRRSVGSSQLGREDGQPQSLPATAAPSRRPGGPARPPRRGECRILRLVHRPEPRAHAPLGSSGQARGGRRTPAVDRRRRPHGGSRSGCTDGGCEGFHRVGDPAARKRGGKEAGTHGEGGREKSRDPGGPHQSRSGETSAPRNLQLVAERSYCGRTGIGACSLADSKSGLRW
ncbi:hypothetical protein THAOC_11825 [Thalassiosira oceanica]|uniref:Uncharacterized protein n=1 Tax=Thalassiosira oceanica TaxID=159749 RepID=K0SQF2_THAOC|nr:hypothetical protein THAOC_11825 [Thalassiosira oceanica]|eukprot:EJK67179.1 hypothetical protein THAOC_11825 [Thalassiosira oceanica]